MKTNSKSSRLKVRTALSLSKTKPLKSKKMQHLQKRLQHNTKNTEPTPAKERQKPVSQIETKRIQNQWLIPARVAFFLNGLYFLAFSIISFLGLFSGFKIIKPFFVLPFDTSFTAFFLLETAAVFAFLVSLMFLHAARYPQLYRWFYFVMILLVLPYHFLSNLQKMQIELPADFQNYLYFDTIVMAILWATFLISLYPYLKSTHNQK